MRPDVGRPFQGRRGATEESDPFRRERRRCAVASRGPKKTLDRFFKWRAETFGTGCTSPARMARMAPAQRMDAEPGQKRFDGKSRGVRRLRGPKKTMVYRGMMNISLSHLPDHALLAEAQRVVAHERQATAQVIALLMELDARRLYLGENNNEPHYRPDRERRKVHCDRSRAELTPEDVIQVLGNAIVHGQEHRPDGKRTGEESGCEGQDCRQSWNKTEQMGKN